MPGAYECGDPATRPIGFRKIISPPNSGGLWWQGVRPAGCQAICFHARVSCIVGVWRLGSSREIAAQRGQSAANLRKCRAGGMSQAKLGGIPRDEACSGSKHVVARSCKAASQRGSSQNEFLLVSPVSLLYILFLSGMKSIAAMCQV